MVTMVVVDQVLAGLGVYLDERRFGTMAAMMVVSRHHGDLKDMKAWWDQVYEARDDPVMDPIARLDVDGIQAWLGEMGFLGLRIAGWRSVFHDLDDWIWDFDEFLEQYTNPVKIFTAVDLLYSLLIGADKLDAALQGSRPPVPGKLKPGMVDAYKAAMFKGPAQGINALRNRAARQVADNLDQALTSGKRLFTLTAPTGIGKTLMAMDAGFRVAQDTDAPVIYCLPFTSIIDQTFVVATRVLKSAGLDPEKQDLLLRHHYLTPMTYQARDSEVLDPDKQEILVEAWESRVVITTFVQLFDTLFSGRNRAMKKLLKIPGAMVILDEVQGIPRGFWDLVRAVIKEWSATYGTRFLLMTATQPGILRRKDPEVHELLPDFQEYFNALSRVDLHLHMDSTIQIADLAEQVMRDVNAGHRRVMAIVNTVTDSLELHNEIKGLLGEQKIPLYYLSSNIIPIEREARIEDLKAANEWVLITTQVVEAGVDLSARVVHRDFAPVDSIVQAAGRCNRNNEYGRGQVHVWRVKRETARKESSQMVYDSTLLDAARHAIAGHGNPIRDTDFAIIVDQYFKDLDKRGAERETLGLLKQMRFEDAGKTARLIENVQANQYFVIMDTDDKAQALWDEYQDILEEPDFRTRRQRFLAIKGEFFKRVIAVREHQRIDGIQPLYQAAAMGSGSYDPETGYVRQTHGGSGGGFII